MGLALVLDGVRADVLASYGAAQQVLVDMDAFDASCGEGLSQPLGDGISRTHGASKNSKVDQPL